MAKGIKTGGRKKGSKNKINRQRELQKAAELKGQTPLEFLLEVMRKPGEDLALRLDAAKTAAPYLHARRAPETKDGKTAGTMIYMHPNLEAED